MLKCFPASRLGFGCVKTTTSICLLASAGRDSPRLVLRRPHGWFIEMDPLNWSREVRHSVQKMELNPTVLNLFHTGRSQRERDRHGHTHTHGHTQNPLLARPSQHLFPVWWYGNKEVIQTISPQWTSLASQGREPLIIICGEILAWGKLVNIKKAVISPGGFLTAAVALMGAADWARSEEKSFTVFSYLQNSYLTSYMIF